MGIYNTVGEIGIQYYAGNTLLAHHYVGDEIDLEDGLYISYEGWFVVILGCVSAEGTLIFDKYGTDIVDDIIDMLEDKHTA